MSSVRFDSEKFNTNIDYAKIALAIVLAFGVASFFLIVFGSEETRSVIRSVWEWAVIALVVFACATCIYRSFQLLRNDPRSPDGTALAGEVNDDPFWPEERQNPVFLSACLFVSGTGSLFIFLAVARPGWIAWIAQSLALVTP